MKETHIILRDATSSTDNIILNTLSVSTSPTSTGSSFAIEVEDNIDTQRLSKLVAMRDVRAVAPSMPIRLIAPVETAGSGPGTQQANASVAWGVNAVKADSSPFTGDGVIVAVLDTGIERSHEAFAAMDAQAIVEKDFTGEGNGDTNGHGTHCAGTIFGGRANGMRIGIAPGVKKVLIGKVIGSVGGSSVNIVQAIQWAQNSGAHVISMSLGMDFPGYVMKLTQQGIDQNAAVSKALEGYRANVLLFERLATTMRAMGDFVQPTIVLAAAGNESKKPTYDIAVSPPAVSEGIVSVAALASDASGLKVASFSNVGANLAAPGVDIPSAKLGGGLTKKSGTSMATPHAAGVAALWMQKLASSPAVLNLPALLRLLLGSTSKDMLAAGFNQVDVGLGMICAPQN